MVRADGSRLGFSSACFAGKTLEEAARLGADLGFTGVEMLAFDGYSHSQGTLSGFYFEHLSASERDALRDLAAGFHFVSTHAPFMDIASFAPNPSVRSTAQEQLRIAVEAVAFLGGRTTTTHLVPRHSFPLAQFRPEIMELYRRLGDLAGELGVTVTIETGYPLGIEEFSDVIWSINHPAVGANVDVGHLRGLVPTSIQGSAEGVALYNDLLEAHVRSLGEKVMHFHLHDIRPTDFRDHRAAGRGFLDWERLIATTANIGYEGWFVFELEEPDLVTALQDSKRRVEAAISTAAR